jgi:hypothetical protein
LKIHRRWPKNPVITIDHDETRNFLIGPGRQKEKNHEISEVIPRAETKKRGGSVMTLRPKIPCVRASGAASTKLP